MGDDLKLPRLSLSDFKNVAMKRFLEVFNYPCPLTSLFTPKMDSRVAIYNGTSSIDIGILTPLLSISKSMGDEGFYFSFVEVYDYQLWYPGMPGDEEYLKSWFIPFKNINDYQSQTFLTNHVIYSQQGNWGVFVSVDHFLLLGGISEFTKQIIHEYPKIDEATDSFIQTWKEWNSSLGYRLEWIPRLLDHIYGAEKSKKLIQKHALNSI
jgi:hypothetical protein